MSIRFDTIAARFRASQSHGPELATYESRHQAEMAHGRPQHRVSRGPTAVTTYRARCSGRDLKPRAKTVARFDPASIASEGITTSTHTLSHLQASSQVANSCSDSVKGGGMCS